MNPIKIMHMADSHLGLNFPFLGEMSDVRRMEILDAFGRLCNMCKELNIDLFLIGGDFLEISSIDRPYLDEVKRLLKEVNCQVFLVAGNHDYLSLDSYYLDEDFPDNVNIIASNAVEKYTIESLKVNVYAASFKSYYQREGFLARGIGQLDPEYINIGLFHGDLGQKDSLYNPISQEEVINSGLDYLALGHIHKRSEIGSLGKTYYAYPGPFQDLSFGDQGGNSVIVGRLSKDFGEFEHIQISGPKLINKDFEITGYETNFQLSEDLRKELEENYEFYKENYYRINLLGRAKRDLNLDLNILKNRLKDLKYLEITDSSVPDLDLEIEAKETNLYGVFIKNYLKIRDGLEKEGRERDLAILDRSLDLALKAFEGRNL